jgi:hypothetical protein
MSRTTQSTASMPKHCHRIILIVLTVACGVCALVPEPSVRTDFDRTRQSPTSIVELPRACAGAFIDKLEFLAKSEREESGSKSSRRLRQHAHWAVDKLAFSKAPEAITLSQSLGVYSS